MSCFTYLTAQDPVQGSAVHSSVRGRLAAGKDRPVVDRLVEEPVVGRLAQEPFEESRTLVGEGRAAELDRPAV